MRVVLYNPETDSVWLEGRWIPVAEADPREAPPLPPLKFRMAQAARRRAALLADYTDECLT